MQKSIFPTSLAASLPPTARIDGFDISAAQYPHREWLPGNVHLYEQDVFQPFAAEFVGVYDVVHVRFFSTLVRPGNLRGLLENLSSLLSMRFPISYCPSLLLLDPLFSHPLKGDRGFEESKKRRRAKPKKIKGKSSEKKLETPLSPESVCLGDKMVIEQRQTRLYTWNRMLISTIRTRRPSSMARLRRHDQPRHNQLSLRPSQRDRENSSAVAEAESGG